MHPSRCLISGNPTPYLPSMAPIGATVQVQQWGEFWKFPDAFTVISSYVEQGQVMLYIKQKNSVHLTVSSHCHWSRISGGFWRKHVIYSYVETKSLIQGSQTPVEMFLLSLAGTGSAPT